MRNLLLLSLLAFSSLLGRAQSYIGGELGMNMIQVSNEDFGKEFQPGWFGGLSYEYKLSNPISLRSGIHFSQGKQTTFSSDTAIMDLIQQIIGDTMPIEGIDLNTYTYTTSRQTQQYLQVPLLASYNYHNITIIAGAYVGFMVGGKRIDRVEQRTPVMALIDFDEIDPTGIISSFLPEPYEKFTSESTETKGLRLIDAGIKAGLGYTMKQFSVQGTYNYGFPDFRYNQGEDELRNHHFFQASVRYMLPLEVGSGGKSRVD